MMSILEYLLSKNKKCTNVDLLSINMTFDEVINNIFSDYDKKYLNKIGEFFKKDPEENELYIYDGSTSEQELKFKLKSIIYTFIFDKNGIVYIHVFDKHTGDKWTTTKTDTLKEIISQINEILNI